MNLNEWLSQFVSLISEMNFEVLKEKKEQLAKVYVFFTKEEKDSIFQLLKDSLYNQTKEYIYTLSMILNIAKEERYMEELLWALEQKNMDVFGWMQFELCCHSSYKTYAQAKRMRERVVQAIQAELLQGIPSALEEKREAKRIVIMTEQILSFKHAPTRVVFEIAYFLQEKLDYQVWVVSVPLMMELGFDEWNSLIHLSYVDFPEEFLYSYKEVDFHCMQIPVKRENALSLKKLMERIVWEIKPAFLYSIGMLNGLADGMQSLIPVVAQTLDVYIPKSTAPVLIKIGEVWDDEIAKQMEYIAGKQTVIENHVCYMENNRDESMTREQLGLPKEKFLIAIVGNRLEIELNEEERQFLKSILEIPNTALVFIGKYPSCEKFFLEEMKKGCVYAIGRQENLMGAYDKMDLYVNPKRMGGGTSAYMALQAGVPVVTLCNCDVASNVGEDFMVSTREEMRDTIVRYVQNKQFYQQQQKKGLEWTSRSMDRAVEEIADMMVEITKEWKKRGWFFD